MARLHSFSAASDRGLRARGRYLCVPKGWSLRTQRMILASCVVVCCSSSSGLALEPPRPVKSLLEMRHDRVTIQNWDLSCGAAALGTILNYQYGDAVSERDIAKGMISRDEYLEDPSLVKARLGFSLLDLKTYVDARGYRGIGYGKLEFQDLIERAPVIVPVNFRLQSFRGVPRDEGQPGSARRPRLGQSYRHARRVRGRVADLSGVRAGRLRRRSEAMARCRRTACRRAPTTSYSFASWNTRGRDPSRSERLAPLKGREC